MRRNIDCFKTVAGRLVIAVFVIAVLAGCGGADEKKQKFFDKGMTLYDQGDYTSARLEFKNAVQIDPKYAEAHYMLGRIGLKQREYREAFKYFSSTVNINPDHFEAQLQLGRMLMGSKAVDQALEKTAIVLNKDPENREALFLKGSGLVMKEEFNSAGTIFEQLIATGNAKPEVYIQSAFVQTKLKNVQQAETIIKAGIAAYPENVSLQRFLANYYFTAKRFDDAAAAMARVIKLEPDQITHRISMANLYWETGKYDEARKHIEEAIADSGNEMENYLVPARFYVSKKRYPEAEQILSEALPKFPVSYDLRFLLSEIKMNLRKPAEAIALMQECLTLNDDPASPNNIKAKNNLAKVYIALGNLDEAEKYADQALAEDPRSIEGLFSKGQIHLYRGQGVQAISVFRTVVNERPQFIRGYIQLSAAHVLNKEPELAVDTLRTALKTEPESKDILRALARVYALQKSYDEAEASLRQIIEYYPKDYAARTDLGDFLFTLKKYDSAAREYRDLQDKIPTHPLSYLRLSRLYLSKDNPDQALAELRDGYRNSKQAAVIFSNLVNLYVRQKQSAKAVKLCQARIKANPKDALAYDALGNIRAAQKRYKQAETAFRKAIALQPLWGTPHNNLARLYLVQGKKKTAVKQMEASIKANKNNLSAYLALGILHERDKAYPKAIDAYRRGLGANPRFWAAANNLAFLLAEHSPSPDYEEALKWATAAQAMRPSEPLIMDTLAWVYYRTGEFNRALMLLEKATAAAPDNSILNYHLGMVLYKLDRPLEAKEKLIQALAEDKPFHGRQEAENVLATL